MGSGGGKVSFHWGCGSLLVANHNPADDLTLRSTAQVRFGGLWKEEDTDFGDREVGLIWEELGGVDSTYDKNILCEVLK